MMMKFKDYIYEMNIYEADKELLKAIGDKDIKRIKYLLGIGASPDCEDGQPLRTAIRNVYNLEIVKILVDNGADITIKGNQPLAMALYSDELEIAKYLISKGAKLNLDQREGSTSDVIIDNILKDEELLKWFSNGYPKYIKLIKDPKIRAKFSHLEMGDKFGVFDDEV